MAYFSASCQFQSGGKTTSPGTGYNSPSLAEWGAAEAKAKRGGASNRSASRPLSLQAGAELTLSEALIAGLVVKKMTNCKIKFKKKMLLGLWFCMFFSLASSGTGRTRLLTNRTREQSTCLDAQVDRRPGAASAALQRGRERTTQLWPPPVSGEAVRGRETEGKKDQRDLGVTRVPRATCPCRGGQAQHPQA